MSSKLRNAGTEQSIINSENSVAGCSTPVQAGICGGTLNGEPAMGCPDSSVTLPNITVAGVLGVDVLVEEEGLDVDEDEGADSTEVLEEEVEEVQARIWWTSRIWLFKD